VAHNRFQHSKAAAPTEEFYATRVVFDIEGNQRELLDANERLVLRYDYDMLGKRIHQASMEGGRRWTLSDVALKTMYTWDSRGHRFRTAYDLLERPTADLLLEDAGPEVLIGRSVYGESRAGAEAHNLRGRIVEIFDQAGIVVTDRYDFKGNQLSSTRQLVDAVEVDEHSEPGYKVRVDWRAAITLTVEKYVSQSRFDAFNRPIQLVAPHSDQTGAKINVLQRVYNDASLLERVDVWLDHGNVPDALVEPAVSAPSAVGVANIDYDAKGQRLRIDYKNGVSTRYGYDFETFRLLHLHTEATGPGQRLQDLDYTFDPTGNITHIRDTAQQTVFFANARVEPSARYIYDAIFRLIEATGREHLGQIGGAPIPLSYNDAPRVGRVGIPNPDDGQALGRYIERYLYDHVGNISSMRHVGSDRRQPGWTQTYAYHEPSQLEPGEVSNRLTSTTIGNGGSETATYSNAGDGYDAHGNMLKMPQLSIMLWNDRDQLQMTQRQVVNQTDVDGEQRQGEQTWYVYDSGGQRVRKVTALPNGRVRDERLYLGAFEVYRKPVDDLVRETLHIMDDKQRIALVETRVQGNEPQIPQELVRYQFGNHVGSACLETDEQARLLSYEEYTPYGSTAYQAVRSQLQTPKRYRFTGMERDEESGLSYHAARYYAPWLARWTACDPAGPVDSVSLYVYARNNPLSFVDPLGSECDPTSQSCVDTTEPTAREEALQQSLPEEERYLPPPAPAISPAASEPGLPGREISSGGVGLTSMGLRSYFAPISASGEALEGPFILWSREALGSARAMEAAGQGYTIFGTPQFGQALAEEALLRQVPGFPGAIIADLPEELTLPIWERYSYIATRNAAIGGVGVTTTNAPGTIPAESIQARIEIPTARWYGAGMGALNVGGGALMLASINTERDPGLITAGKITSGGASVVGGGLEIYGAWTLTAGATTTGAALSGVGTVIAVPIIMYEIGRPRGIVAIDPLLRDRAIQRYRSGENVNPFCAQCHGPGGALDPNNDWNAGGARRDAFVRRLQWVDLGE
jgi:RHS repeat-associated protein